MSDKNKTSAEIKKPRFRKTGKFIGFLIVTYVVYKLFYPTYSWGEKMTITVITPTGEVTRSAVRHVSYTEVPPFLTSTVAVEKEKEGEALVLPLGNNRYLFALLGGSGAWADSIHRIVFPGDRKLYGWRFWATDLFGKGAVELPQDHFKYIEFVQFEDLNDPKSVQPVDPERLAESFGEGYRINSITIEVVFERTTFGEVDKVLTWLDDLNGKALDGASSSYINAENPLANNLHLYRFRRK